MLQMTRLNFSGGKANGDDSSYIDRVCWSRQRAEWEGWITMHTSTCHCAHLSWIVIKVHEALNPGVGIIRLLLTPATAFFLPSAENLISPAWHPASHQYIWGHLSIGGSFGQSTDVCKCARNYPSWESTCMPHYASSVHLIEKIDYRGCTVVRR